MPNPPDFSNAGRSEINEPTTNLRQRALSALFWSLLQSWGGRVLGLLVFVVLARLLVPAQFGLASSAFLIISLLNLVAEFGYGDALVQRPDLKPADVNLPFYASIALAILLACGAALFAPQIAELMGVPDLAPYIVGCAAISPLVTVSVFQETMYRRALFFKPLAMRTLAGILLGGIVGLVMAYLGFGTWALIVQLAIQNLVSALWLWMRPVWLPSKELHRQSFKELSLFGTNVVAMRLLDFITVRSVDLVILLTSGPAALGLFTVSSRLYLLLLQLLQSSISNVALSTLSKVSNDKARLGRLYERSSSISATLGTPIFFGLAALAPEVNLVMFGAHWAGAEKVMMPLLLMGGVHCVQFVNASYLTAVGQPRTLLGLVVLKAIFVLPALFFFRMDDVAGTAMVYAAALLALTPFSFYTVLRALSLGWGSLWRSVGGPFIACAAGFLAVYAAREFIAQPDNVLVRAIMLGAIFTAAYGVASVVFALNAVRENIRFIRSALGR